MLDLTNYRVIAELLYNRDTIEYCGYFLYIIVYGTTS